jgi:hypothetical protein
MKPACGSSASCAASWPQRSASPFSRPGLIRDAEAAALRPYAYIMAAILCLRRLRALVPRGGSVPERGRGAVVAMTATVVFLFGMLAIARPRSRRRRSPGRRTSPPQIARGLIGPGDRVFHYHNYFQDFPYYTRPRGGPRAPTRTSSSSSSWSPAERRRSGSSTTRISAARVGRPGPGLRRRAHPGHAGPLRRAGLQVLHRGQGPGHYLFSNQP